jgi:predicted nucleotidyltransferase component of viral defense system
MIEKQLVQWHASDAGVDLGIAEREIILAYVLSILSDGGLLKRLAFKDGTAIHKLYLGGTGRFSLDLDFSAISDTVPDALMARPDWPPARPDLPRTHVHHPQP